MTAHLYTFVNKALQTEHSLISQHNSTTEINNNQLFNIRQQEYYLVTDELKCHNFKEKGGYFESCAFRLSL